ncbi:DUF1641 domain-containing protein [Bacillus smithii]|uniref:DUF1641 domain-containing protein n=1 Tax=Bacillus smithii TaxID=1479 RepID=UPI0030C997DC
MAEPITFIRKKEMTKEEQIQQKLDELKSLLADHDDDLTNLLKIIGELNQAGLLEAANAMLQAREKIAKIALGQVSREPVTNLINNLMGVAGAVSNIDPDFTEKLMNSITNGIKEGNHHLQNGDKVKFRDLLKVLNDPDINRAIGFGLHFLKGMGQGLKENG